MPDRGCGTESSGDDQPYAADSGGIAGCGTQAGCGDTDVGRDEDLSVRTNQGVLGKLLKGIPLVPIPFLGRRAGELRGVKKGTQKEKEALEWLAEEVRLA